MYRGPLSRLGEWLGSATALRTLGLGSTIYMALVIALISIQSGGLVNVMPGCLGLLHGAIILLVGSAGLTPRAHHDPLHAGLPSWVEILTIVVLLAIALSSGLPTSWTSRTARSSRSSSCSWPSSP